MSSKMFQSIMSQMKEATSRSIGVIEIDGTIVAGNDLTLVGSTIAPISEINMDEDCSTVCCDGRTYRVLGNGVKGDYAVFVDGVDEESRMICIMTSVAINEAGINLGDITDKRAFIKSVVTGNILPSDVFARAKDLRINAEATRGVIVMRRKSGSGEALLEILQTEFSTRHDDYIIATGDKDVTVVREITGPRDSKFMMKTAEEIRKLLCDKHRFDLIIGVGTSATQIKELSDRYKEALLAVEIGAIFEPEEQIISYENLGIGRLIYQLPKTLCEIYLSEVFKSNPIESLDRELLTTIDKFFENSLNIAQTSQKLFIHRNTLVYRIEKIKRLTGLDLRIFDQAIVFKVALMVKKHLKLQETEYK